MVGVWGSSQPKGHGAASAAMVLATEICICMHHMAPLHVSHQANPMGTTPTNEEVRGISKIRLKMGVG